jgi:hypothetical protein
LALPRFALLAVVERIQNKDKLTPK